MALAYSSAESWGSQQFRLKSYSESFAMYPPGIYPIILQLLPCKKLLEQACGISALLVLPCVWQDWTIQRCSDVLKWNKTKLAVWNLLSLGVTALLFLSAAWKQQSLQGKFTHVTSIHPIFSPLISSFTNFSVSKTLKKQICYHSSQDAGYC